MGAAKRTGAAWRRVATLAAALSVGLALGAGPAFADHVSVQGSAYGIFADTSLLGGIEVPAQPDAFLPPGETDSVASVGPAALGTLATVGAGLINVSSTAGADGGGHATANSYAEVTNPSLSLIGGAAVLSGTTVLRSECTAGEAGASGSTTVVSGTLTIGTNPATVLNPGVIVGTVNLSIPGVANITLNEQTNPGIGTNSITVNAIHIQLLGALGTPVADIIYGSSTCAATVGPPLAVKMRSFSGKLTKRGALLRWQTGSEADVLGFNIYRSKAATRVKVNRSLIAARNPFGRSYSYLDRAAKGKKLPGYWLQVVHLDGSSKWFRIGRAAH